MEIGIQQQGANGVIINTASGSIQITDADSYGIEIEAKWSANDSLQLFSTLGILKTKYQDFESTSHMLATVDTPYDMDGRAFAHSPEYQLVVGANYFFTDNWILTSQIEAKDSLNATTVANTIALQNGANILRVHDVKEAVESIKVWGMSN